MTEATNISPPSAWHHLARLAALLALGAASSLAVAWALSILTLRMAPQTRLWIEHRSLVVESGADASPPMRSALASAAWSAAIAQRFQSLCPSLDQAAETRIVEHRTQAPGFELAAVACRSLADRDDPGPERYEAQILTCDAGWPFRAWSAELTIVGNFPVSGPLTIHAAADAAALGTRSDTGPVTVLWPTPLRAPLPIRPRWPALPFEILVHASGWTVVLASARWVRTALRLRARRCPHCGYHLAGLASCPECGRSPDTP